MKPYMPAIVLLVALVALVGGGFITANMLKSPEASFTREVDAKVEKAQRLLVQYEGGQPALLAAVEDLVKAGAAPRALTGEPTTQPATTAAPAAEDVSTSGEQDLLAREGADSDSRRQERNNRLAKLGGKPFEPPPGINTLEELDKRIGDNAALLDSALEIVRDALSTSGDNGLSGANHPVATRLEAQLLYQKADLLRRLASVSRTRADVERGVFDRVVLAVHQADSTVDTIQRELNGVAGGVVGEKADKPAAPKTGKSKLGRLLGIFKNPTGLMGAGAGPAKKKPAADEPAKEPTEPAPSDNEADKATAEPKPAAEPVPVAIAAVPSIDERIKALQTQGGEVDAQIAEAQKEADRLSTAVKGLQTELATARSRSDDAQKRMMELVNAGVDPVDPKAMQQFVDEYGKAAKTDREATHEATALKDGIVRNAKPDAQEENDILTAPLVPADGSGQIKESPGLTALEADLRAAEVLVGTRQDLRKLIDAQIKALETQREELTASLAKAQAWKAGLTAEATRHVEAAGKWTAEALELEKKALDFLAQGQTAASQAQSAAGAWSTKVSEFHRKNAAPSPQTGYMAAHAEAVAGDIEMQRAWVLAQQALGLEQQALLLGRMPTTQPAAKSDAGSGTTARKEAIEAAKAALEKYKSAADKLGGLWTLHTQMAAAHYLMASLQTGDEAQKSRAEGLKEYQSATRDRGELGRDYRPMIQALSAPE